MGVSIFDKISYFYVLSSFDRKGIDIKQDLYYSYTLIRFLKNEKELLNLQQTTIGPFY